MQGTEYLMVQPIKQMQFDEMNVSHSIPAAYCLSSVIFPLACG